jgi:Uncharacterized conserved small protein
MSDRKLSLKPLRQNGTSRKLTISLDPELAEELDLYATAYSSEYGCVAETDALLIPIIRAFLERDRLFQKWKRQQQGTVPRHTGRQQPVASAPNAPSTDPSTPTME